MKGALSSGDSIAWKSDDADPVMTLKGEFTDVALHEHAVHTETMALASGETIGSQVERHAFADKGGRLRSGRARFSERSDSLAISYPDRAPGTSTH